MGGLGELWAPDEGGFGLGTLEEEDGVLPGGFALLDAQFVAFPGAHYVVGFEAGELLLDVFDAVLGVGSGFVYLLQELLALLHWIWLEL